MGKDSHSPEEIKNPRRNIVVDSILISMAAALVYLPTVQALMDKIKGNKAFFGSLKDSFSTTKGWGNRVIEGVFIATPIVLLLGMAGSYGKQTKTAPINDNKSCEPFEPTLEKTSSKFQEKELARREHVQEQGAQVG